MRTLSLRSRARIFQRKRVLGMPVDIWFSSPLFLLLLILFACIL